MVVTIIGKENNSIYSSLTKTDCTIRWCMPFFLKKQTSSRSKAPKGPKSGTLGANSAGLEKGSLDSVEGSPTFLYICLPVFSSKKVLWKVPRTSLCIRLPVFSGYVEGSPNSSVHLSANFLFEKGSVEGSPNIFWGPWGKFSWPRKRFSGFCGRFPNFSLHLSPSLLFQKGFVEGSPN